MEQPDYDKIIREKFGLGLPKDTELYALACVVEKGKFLYYSAVTDSFEPGPPDCCQLFDMREQLEVEAKRYQGGELFIVTFNLMWKSTEPIHG